MYPWLKTRRGIFNPFVLKEDHDQVSQLNFFFFAEQPHYNGSVNNIYWGYTRIL